MATKEELFKAVRLIKEHCHGTKCHADKCPLFAVCEVVCGNGIAPSPCSWPDPEGCGKADKKTNCSDCGNQHTPVCKYCEHDAEGGV